MDLILDPSIMKTGAHHIVYIEEVLSYFINLLLSPSLKYILSLNSFLKIAAIWTDIK